LTEKTRIIYITRKYPPTIGGMEWYNYYLSENLAQFCNLHLIALRGSQIWVPFFIIFAFFKATILAFSYNRKCTVILGDGAIAPLGVALRVVCRVKVLAVIHGLDVIYKKFGYQKIVLPFLRKLDAVISNSQGTAELALAANLDPEKIFIVNPGISQHTLSNLNRKDARAALNFADTDGPVILYVGRLIKRKGITWFVSSVLPLLIERLKVFKLVIVGDGPQSAELQQFLKSQAAEQYVRVLGNIIDEELATYYRAADIFVMPNIAVENDFEGFGLVTLEAAANGAVVVAAELPGIADAIIDKENGFLVESGNAQGFADSIINVLSSDELAKQFSLRAQAFTLVNFQWRKSASEVLSIVEQEL